MAKHTTGTWKLEDGHIVGDRYVCELSRWHIAGAGTSYPEENAKLEAEYIANALLICEAPHLLEKLRLACEVLRARGEDGIAAHCEATINHATKV